MYMCMVRCIHIHVYTCVMNGFPCTYVYIQAASASRDPLLNSIFPESELQSKKRPPTVSEHMCMYRDVWLLIEISSMCRV